jgi:ammonia channel protein AmtB
MPAAALEARVPDSGATAWLLTSTALVLLINAVVPLRVSREQENEGLDLVLHEERGHSL